MWNTLFVPCTPAFWLKNQVAIKFLENRKIITRLLTPLPLLNENSNKFLHFSKNWSLKQFFAKTILVLSHSFFYWASNLSSFKANSSYWVSVIENSYEANQKKKHLFMANKWLVKWMFFRNFDLVNFLFDFVLEMNW